MFKSKILRTLAISLSIFSVANLSTFEAAAITIDEFQVSSQVSSPLTAGSKASRVDSSSTALGGHRQLTANNISGHNSETTLRTGSATGVALLQFSLGENEGSGIVEWDGDGDPAVLTPDGLGSIDLTQDGGSAFRIPLNKFDLAFGKPITVVLAIYDASNPDPERFSEVSITINQAYSAPPLFVISLPFSLFTTSGVSNVPAPGGATFATRTRFGTVGSGSPLRVGAMRLTIIGDSSDLSISSLTTDGRCTLTPNAAGAVVDECGVCLNDADVNQGRDACGVCFKGPSGYDYDTNKKFDACGLCPADSQYLFPSGSKDSCGVCLAGPSGYTYSDPKDDCGLCPSHPSHGHAKDPCGVCLGNGSSCADCTGTPNGTTKYDLCGVCGGNNTTCSDCSGVPNGKLVNDACGICGGDGTSCRDCLGVVNGTNKVDACGVCGGKISNATECEVSALRCSIVKATKEIETYEKTLVTKAKAVRARYIDERRRGQRAACGFNPKERDTSFSNAYSHIMTRSNEIFSSGIEVCGNTCVTTTYADQVEALLPHFKTMQQQAVSMARDVKKCYNKRGIARSGEGTRGVADTMGRVNQGLANLIKACRAKKVCPSN